MIPLPTTLIFFANGCVACCDQYGEQIARFQGPDWADRLTDVGVDWQTLKADGRPNIHHFARAYRHRIGGTCPGALKGGFVVMWGTTPAGWVLELDQPYSWRPGCKAVAIDGQLYQAVGGTYDFGAEDWVMIDGRAVS